MKILSFIVETLLNTSKSYQNILEVTVKSIHINKLIDKIFTVTIVSCRNSEER